MSVKLNVTSSALVACILGVVQNAASQEASRAAATTQTLTKSYERRLASLPDSAVVEAQGRRVTVGEIKARSLQLQQQAEAKIQAAAVSARERFSIREAQFRQQRDAKLAADNAKAVAEVARLHQIAAIQQEAAQLLARSRTTAAADRAEIDRRAKQLLEQLQQLRKVSVAPRVRR